MTAEFAQVATFQPQTPPVASLASQALPRPLTAVNALHVTQAMWQLLEHQTAVHAQQALHPMQREVSASSATQVSIPGRVPKPYFEANTITRPFSRVSSLGGRFGDSGSRLVNRKGQYRKMLVVLCEDFRPELRPRSARCSMCEPGFAPDATRSSCQKCLGQSYANPGDELCRACSFPSMILNDDNWCTPIYTILFVFGFILLMLFVMTAFGRLRLECLRWRLKDLIQAKNWHDLHATKCTFLEYGLCKKKADRLLNARKADVKAESFQLGICLQYVFDHLEGMYTERAQQAEWRFHEWPLTKTGYLVKIRNFGLQVVDPEAAWNALPTCS